MIVKDDDEIEALGVDVELENVHLNQLQGARGLEAVHLRRPWRFELRWGVAVGLEELADGLGIAAKTDTAELVVDLAGPKAGVIAPDREHLLLGALRDLNPWGFGEVAQRLSTVSVLISMVASDGAIAHPAIEAPGRDPC
jgi:hypothetical protein